MILSDPKSQELYDLLRREREITSPTTQDLINCRRNTERVLGPDENLFRVDWVWLLHSSIRSHPDYSAFQLPEPKTMTIQLIGKDDGAYDDSEVLTGRWQSYMESFVSVCLSSQPGVVHALNRLIHSTITLLAFLRHPPFAAPSSFGKLRYMLYFCFLSALAL